MVWEKVGLELGNLKNVTAPNITVPNSSQALWGEMVSSASSMGLWFEIIILTSIFLVLVWALGEQSPLSSFRYNYLRAINLALGITTAIGINLLLTGIADSFRVVAVFFMINLLSVFSLIAVENKE